MNIMPLIDMLDRLSFNHHRVHNLKNIYFMVTAGKVCFQDDFILWFEKKIKEMNLIEGIDYRYRRPGYIDTVFVRGHVGYDMIRFEDNEYGKFIRETWGIDKLRVVNRKTMEYVFDEDEEDQEDSAC